MTRNLKALGLALVAAMALGAIGAQGASAAVDHEFESAAEDTVLTGKSHSYSSSQTSQHIFTATSGLTVECDATFVGRNQGKTRDTVSARPVYTNCKDSATVTNTGCEFIFDSDTTTSAHSSTAEHAAVDLNCEHEHWIEVSKPGCKLRFEDTHTSSSVTVNQDIHGVRYTNVTDSSKHAITVTATASTIKYTVLSGSFCGLVGHPAGTYNSGSYAGTAEVTGYEFKKKLTGDDLTTGTTYEHSAQVDITISDTTNTP